MPRSSESVIRIAIVDDDHMLLGVFSSLMKRSNFHTHFFLDAVKALEKISEIKGHYNLVISDIRMPNMDGLEFARKIRSIEPNLPIILMTGYGLALTPEQIEAAGIHQLLIKPTTIHALGTAVHAALATATGKSVPRISS